MSPHSTASPAVSVIVLNWNGAKYLPRCLDAVVAQTLWTLAEDAGQEPPLEVIVLDNASTDGSVDGLETLWPAFRLVRFSENLGFAAANNRGAHQARGRWLAFLNNDAFPEPDWLAKLLEAAQNHPDFTFFASRIHYAGESNASSTVQSTGDVYHVSGSAWSRDNRCPLEQAHLQEEEVFSPCAAAAMYEREAFLQAGGFDERFCSHLEDVDLGFRLRLAGRRCLYVPDAVVAHVVSASYGVESDRTVYQVQRNLVWTYFANMPGWLFWKYLPAHLFANLVFLAHYTLRGKGRSAWRAKWDALRGLPAAWRKRRMVQRDRRATLADIERVMDHGWSSPFVLGNLGNTIRRLGGYGDRRASPGEGGGRR